MTEYWKSGKRRIEMILRTMNWMIIAALLPAFLGCGEDETPQADAVEPVAVRTVQVAEQSVGQQVAYAGTVQPIEQVRLATRIMGWVDDIPFKEGARVQKGAVLVKLRSKDIEAKRAQAEAAIAEAEAHFKNVETNLRRVESLFAKKAATQKELDDIRAAFTSAQSRKKAAEEMKAEVQEMLSYTELRAPFDGVVARKFLEIADLANPGMPILEVENMERVKVVAKVSEREVRNLSVGMPVVIEVAAAQIGANGETLAGKIDRIVPAADPMSRQFDIHVIADNSSGRIKSGMFARVVVRGDESEGALMVPQSAVFRRGQLEGLFIVDSSNTARLRWVRTGVRENGSVEILSGLNPGEQVVNEVLDKTPGSLRPRSLNSGSLVDGQVVSAERIRSGGEEAQ
jgi:RND family efflux transporter MFP subunit